MERKQFTFYESFYKAMRKIKNKAARADIFDALCSYVFYGQEPNENDIHPGALMMFEMAKPVLDSAHKKAEAAIMKHEKYACKTAVKQMQNVCTTSAQGVQNGCEKESEVEKELEIELEHEREQAGVGERFEIFWKEFPKKADKNAAWEAFQGVQVPLQVLLDALRAQKNSPQWLAEGGRFVPRAAAWLRDGRWEDALPQENKVPMGSGKLGEAELAAIRQMLAEGIPD